MPIYLKLQDIEGEVKDARYKGWIQLESLSFGRTPGLPGSTGGVQPGSGATPELTASMITNSASVKLFQATGAGRPLGKAIVVMDNGTPEKEKTHGFALERTFLANYSIGGTGGGGLPLDSFALVGTKLVTLTEAELKELLKAPSAPPRRRR